MLFTVKDNMKNASDGQPLNKKSNGMVTMVEQRRGFLCLPWPAHLLSLGLSMLVCIFPFVGMFYLMLGYTSNPWMTRIIYLLCLVLWATGLWRVGKTPRNLTFPDWMMLFFFLLGLVAYFRTGFPGHAVEYFVVLNVMAYLVGRLIPGSYHHLSLLYIVGFSLITALMFIVGIPELYNQWGLYERGHPVLFGFIKTVGGLDIVLGYLPVLAAAYLLARKKIQYNISENTLLVLIAIGILVTALIASRSVLFAILGSILFATVVISRDSSVLIQFKLIAVMVVSVFLASVIAPENNKSFYKSWKLGTSIEVLQGDIASFDLEMSDHGDMVDYGDIDPTDSAAIRIFLWKEAFYEIIDNPALGLGGRQWRYTRPHPHNIILEGGVMFGIPALIAFMLSIFYTLWLLFIPSGAQNSDRRVLAVLVGLLFVYLLFYNMVQGHLASFRTMPLFIMFGMAVAVIAENIHGSNVSRD